MNPDRTRIEQALPGYEIGVELGRGAWGVVMSGRHKRLGRKVAIKQLPRAFAADPAVAERFLREAQMAAALDHPHIVPVYDYVEDEGLALIVMEECPGTIAAKFHGEGIHTDEACAATLATCSALSYAHRRGVLHRDIKPENLLLDDDGTVKLADFGIARALDAATRLTATGTVVGTPAYMSPEQAGGEDLTEASDVYSLGVVLYELLSGELPFTDVDSWGALLRQHMFEPPRPLLEVAPDVPSRVAAVVDQALAKQPADRWQSASDFGVALAEATSHAFGAGWLRQRRFALLSAPDIIAATERNVGGDGRGGTMIVRGNHHADPGAAATTAPAGTATPTPPNPTAPVPTPTPPPAPPTGSETPTVGAVVPPTSPPPAQHDGVAAFGGVPTAPPTVPPPAGEPPPASMIASGESKGPAWGLMALIGGGALLVIGLLAVLVFMAFDGGGSEAGDAVPTAAPDEAPEGDADDGTDPEPADDGTDPTDGGTDPAEASDDGAAEPTTPPPIDEPTAQLTIGSLIDAGEFARDEDQQVTIMLAVDDVNEAGGVLGSPLNYLEGTYSDDAELAITAADQVRQGASALIGPTDAVATDDVLPTVTGGGSVLVSPSDFFSRPDDTGLYFQTRIPATLIAPAAVSILPEGVSRITVLFDDSTSSTEESVRVALETALAASGYTSTRVTVIDDDFSTAVAEIPATTPDAIMIYGIIGKTDLYNAMLTAGLGPQNQPIVVVDNDGGAVDMGDGRITGIQGITRDALTGNALEDRLPASDFSADASQAYDAVIIVALAAEQAGSTDPAAIAAELPAVTAGGTECTTFAACRDLVAAGTDIDYVGPGGPYELSPETGRPTAGYFRRSLISDSGFSSGQTEQYLFASGG